MVQIAWIVFDTNGNRIKNEDFIIKPEGFSIPEEASRIHGITTSMALIEGIELLKVLNKFNQKVDEATILIAHNMSFDSKIIGAEMFRKKIKPNFNIKQFIRNKYGCS